MKLVLQVGRKGLVLMWRLGIKYIRLFFIIKGNNVLAQCVVMQKH